MRPRKFAKIKDVFINFSVKKGPHITKFKDARANGGPKIKLKGALSNKKKRTGQRRLQELEYGHSSSEKQRGFGQKQ